MNSLKDKVEKEKEKATRQDRKISGEIRAAESAMVAADLSGPKKKVKKFRIRNFMPITRGRYEKVLVKLAEKYSLDSKEMLSRFNREIDSTNLSDNGKEMMGELLGLAANGDPMAPPIGSFLNELTSNEEFIQNGLASADATFGKRKGKTIFEALKGKKTEKEMHVYETVVRLVRSMLGAYGVYSAPISFDSAQHEAQTKVSWTRYFFDPIAKNAINQLMFFALGSGIKITVLSDKIDSYIQRMLMEYRFQNEQKWNFRRALLSGELIYIHEDNPDEEMISISSIPFEYIDDVKKYRGKPVMFKIDYEFFGSVTMNEIGKENDFKWVSVSNFDSIAKGKTMDDFLNEREKKDAEIDKDSTISLIKWGDSFRGEPILISVLRWLQIMEEFNKNISRLINERARVIMKKKIYKSAISRQNTDDIRNAPPGGYMIIEIPGEKEYEFMSPKIETGGIGEVKRILRSVICAGLHMPEHILFSDASNNNYASVLEAKNPFVVFVSFLRDWFGEELERALRDNIRMAMEKGYLEKKVDIKTFDTESVIEVFNYIADAVVEGETVVTEITKKAKDILKEDNPEKILSDQVPIMVDFPLLQSEDALQQAQALQIHYNLGVDLETIQKKLGYDPKEILANKIRERRLEKDQKMKDEAEFNQGKNPIPPDFTGEGGEK